MNEWHEVRFGAIATLKKGINYKSEDYRSEGSGHPFITIKCFVKGGGYEQTGLKFFGGHFTTADQLFEGDILFSVTDLTRAGDIVGSPLRVPFFGDDAVAVASMDCMKIEPDASLCNKEFLYHRMMLPDVRRQMVAYSAGSTVLHLDTKKVPRISVCIPKNIRAQQKIAHILQTIDRAIEHTAALIEKYRQVKAGLMHYLFTRGIGADGKLRPPREQAPHLYKETPIGWIPKEWELDSLDSVANIIDPQPDHRTPPEHLEGMPYIGIGDFDEFGDLDFLRCRKVIREAFNKQRLRFQTTAGDIIFGKIGTIGKPKSLPIGDYALSANVVLIQPSIQRNFMRHCLDVPMFMKQIMDITNTTSQPALGIEKIRKIKVPVPVNAKEKSSIAQKLDSLDSKIFSEARSLEKFRNEKSGLMHDLLTGKVPVTISDTTLEKAQTTRAAVNE